MWLFDLIYSLRLVCRQHHYESIQTRKFLQGVDALYVFKVASVCSGSYDEADPAFLLLPGARHQAAGRVILQGEKYRF